MEHKYGLLKYETHNFGDIIQSLAAKRFLPKVDVYLDRDHLNKVNTDKKIVLIMNGWFTHKPENWPPHPAIDPLFVAFHIAESASKGLTSPEAIQYFKKHEPIGCRDYCTLDLLKSNGVDAYFSGCLTLTLKNESSHRTNEIFIVDVDSDIIKSMPPDLLERCQIMSHYLDTAVTKITSDFVINKLKGVNHFIRNIKPTSPLRTIYRRAITYHVNKTITIEKQFEEAQKLLDSYSRAKFVITSRLHCALPCLAFNTPVIFVHSNLKDPRFKGFLQHMICYSPEEFKKKCHEINWDTPFENPSTINEMRNELIQSCEDFINSR
jgi:hypothetical protein